MAHPLSYGRREKGPQTFIEQNQDYLVAVIHNTNTPIFLKTADFKYIFMNREFERLSRTTLDKVKGKDDFSIFPKAVAELFRSQDEEVVKRRKGIEFEETIPLPDGEHTFITAKFPLFDHAGNIGAVGGICSDISARKRAEAELREAEEKYHRIVDDITRRKKTEDALRKAHEDLELRVVACTEELDRKTKLLEETNIALEILLEKRDADKKDFERKVAQNIEKLIRPYLEKIKLSPSDSSREALLKIIHANLDEITTYPAQHQDYLAVLTPAQRQIADLVKHGHTTKEIAHLLNLSPSTIACHRQEIRKRLSLTNKKINLQSALAVNPT